MSMPRIPGRPGANPAKGYAQPKFAFRESDSLTASGPDRVGVVLLAAGRGTRFGAESPKTLARLGRRPLVTHAVAAATMSGLRPVVVVASVSRGTAVVAIIVRSVEAMAIPPSARASRTAVAVALADQPRIGADAYRRLAGAHREGAELAVATYDGKRGHPVLIGRSHFDEAMRLTGDEGARSLLAAHDVVEVACDGTGDATDVDTPADLAALEGPAPG